MSLGSIVRCWASAGYEPSLLFYDRLYSVAQQQAHEFRHWWTNKLAVVLHDYERRELLAISPGRCGCEAANPTDLVSRLSRLADIIKKVLGELGQTELHRMGFQLVVYADLGLAFKELMARLRPICLPENERLEALTSCKISDIALNFDYQRDAGTVKLRAGPMNTEQGLERIKNLGEHTRLFETPGAGTGLADFYGQIPRTFLYADIEIFTEGKHRLGEWTTFIENAQAHARSVFKGLRAMVMEEDT